MSDLSSMIDDTTERLLRKIDNWEVPQSDKKYVTIEKEVWESTLRASMNRAGEIETLQEQLEIAVKCLKKYAETKDILMVSKDGTCQITLRDCEGYHLARETLKKIKELNK